MIDEFFATGPITSIAGLSTTDMKVKSLGKTFEIIIQFFLFYSLPSRNQ